MEKTRQRLSERVRTVASYCQNLDVLDIGCGAHSIERIEGTDWLHGALAKVAKKLVGVELVPELVERMKELGYTVIQGDAETFDAHDKFDVVVAGELIEHVNNQLAVLLNLRRHLRNDGRLVVTTPNAMSWHYAGKTLMTGMFCPNTEHALWHDEHTLREVMRRAGFHAERLLYLANENVTRNKSADFFYIVDRVVMSFRLRLAPGLLMVCRLDV
jgi:2-polyprenyl-3-methyl-5-hydroxy-6-metoxy-1,4-benzoquinol methylase